jgi:hypothetical protein
VRLWSLHPCYLDPKGLVALWREGLLARAVLKKETQGYQQHPQLERFRACGKPVACIDQYLRVVYEEALKRGYRFDVDKLGHKGKWGKIGVTVGQLQYEWKRLQAKLRWRNRPQYEKNQGVMTLQSHPLFEVRAGGIASWERMKKPD